MKREIIVSIIILMSIGVEISQGFSLDALFHYKPSCHFACANGTRPQPQSPETASDRIADTGCKPFNVSYEFFGDMSDFPDCCDELTECYSQCGVPYDVCNMLFSTCLHESCSEIGNQNDGYDLDSIVSSHVCRETAEALRKVTEKTRCDAYLEAQKSECSC